MTDKQNYTGGGHRDSEEGKIDFTLLFAEGVPYEEQPIVKLAAYMTEKAAHYGSRNWEKFHTQEPRDHTERSLLRHVIKDVCGEVDEPHDIATLSNVMFKMVMDWKIRTGWTPPNAEEEDDPRTVWEKHFEEVHGYTPTPYDGEKYRESVNRFTSLVTSSEKSTEDVTTYEAHRPRYWQSASGQLKRCPDQAEGGPCKDVLDEDLHYARACKYNNLGGLLND